VERRLGGNGILLGLILKGDGRDRFGDAVSLSESRLPGEPALTSGAAQGAESAEERCLDHGNWHTQPGYIGAQ
jgi:hypothetical protein